MTITKEDPEIAVNTDLPVVTAVGIEEKVDENVASGTAGGENQGPPVPAGHARFYCSKCRTVSFEFLWAIVVLYMNI